MRTFQILMRHPVNLCWLLAMRCWKVRGSGGAAVAAKAPLEDNRLICRQTGDLRGYQFGARAT